MLRKDISSWFFITGMRYTVSKVFREWRTDECQRHPKCSASACRYLRPGFGFSYQLWRNSEGVKRRLSMSWVAGCMPWVIFRLCCMEWVIECSCLPSTDGKSLSRNRPPRKSGDQTLILCPSFVKGMVLLTKLWGNESFSFWWPGGAWPLLVAAGPECKLSWGKSLGVVGPVSEPLPQPAAQPCHSALTHYQQFSEFSFSFIFFFSLSCSFYFVTHLHLRQQSGSCGRRGMGTCYLEVGLQLWR